MPVPLPTPTLRPARQRVSLRNADVRAAYLKVYRDTGFHSHACRAVGVGCTTAAHYRSDHPEFAASCAAIDRRRTTPLVYARRRRPTAAARVVFLTTLAAGGNVDAAAVRAGITTGHVYTMRSHSADFAADWAAARNRALDRVEDVLFDGVLNGFTRTETVGEVVKIVVVQRPDVMLRLLGTRRNADRPGLRTLELTPELLASARAKLERQLRHAAASGNADAAIAALPLAKLPAPRTPDTGLAIVPPATVSAR